MLKSEKQNISLQKELIKILGYIASLCFFLVIVFFVIYAFMPFVTDDFQGIKIDIPFVKTINIILAFTIVSINNLFTYIFLVMAGIISYMTAQYLELNIKKIKRTSKKNTDAEKDKASDRDEALPASGKTHETKIIEIKTEKIDTADPIEQEKTETPPDTVEPKEKAVENDKSTKVLKP